MKATTALPALLLGLGIPLLVWGQSTARLEVEASPGQGVKIVAQQVSYGEVLRAFQQKLGVPIDIPPAADQLLLSYVHIDATPPPPKPCRSFSPAVAWGMRCCGKWMEVSSRK